MIFLHDNVIFEIVSENYMKAKTSTQQSTSVEQAQNTQQSSGGGSNSSQQELIAQAQTSFVAALQAEGGKLRIGMKDSAATSMLQQFLLDNGYGISKVDGWFGNNTASCVRKFQADHNLHVDGWIGMQTGGIIESMRSGGSIGNGNSNSNSNSSGSSSGGSAQQSPQPATPPPAPTTLSAPPAWLEKGAKGANVTSLQNALNSLNFSCGNADGDFGNRTRNALVQFQMAAKLTPDGRYGPVTKTKLAQALSGGMSSLTQNQNQNQSTAPAVESTGAGQQNGAVWAAIAWALSQQGAPYYGGASPFRDGSRPGNGKTYQQDGQQAYVSQAGVIGYDCSGFVMAFNRQLGKPIGDQYTGSLKANFPHVSKNALLPGDIIVKTGHVVIYIGNNEVVHATNPVVKKSNATTFINDSDYVGRRTW